MCGNTISELWQWMISWFTTDEIEHQSDEQSGEATKVHFELGLRKQPKEVWVGKENQHPMMENNDEEENGL